MNLSSSKVYGALCQLHSYGGPSSRLSPSFKAEYLPEYWAQFKGALASGTGASPGSPGQLRHLVLTAGCTGLRGAELDYLLSSWCSFQYGLSCRSVTIRGEVSL